jgi:hypothetical protein
LVSYKTVIRLIQVPSYLFKYHLSWRGREYVWPLLWPKKTLPFQFHFVPVFIWNRVTVHLADLDQPRFTKMWTKSMKTNTLETTSNELQNEIVKSGSLHFKIFLKIFFKPDLNLGINLKLLGTLPQISLLFLRPWIYCKIFLFRKIRREKINNE